MGRYLNPTFQTANAARKTMTTQRPRDAFPVRVSGAPCEGCSVVGTRRIELQRPRSTIRKPFDLGLVCADLS